MCLAREYLQAYDGVEELKVLTVLLHLELIDNHQVFEEVVAFRTKKRWPEGVERASHSLTTQTKRWPGGVGTQSLRWLH